MSQHRSLRSSSTIAAKRNVLKRFERVDLLKKRGLWKQGRSVMNLPKTKPDADAASSPPRDPGSLHGSRRGSTRRGNKRRNSGDGRGPVSGL